MTTSCAWQAIASPFFAPRLPVAAGGRSRRRRRADRRPRPSSRRPTPAAPASTAVAQLKSRARRAVGAGHRQARDDPRRPARTMRSTATSLPGRSPLGGEPVPSGDIAAAAQHAAGLAGHGRRCARTASARSTARTRTPRSCIEGLRRRPRRRRSKASIMLARAHVALGDADAARAVLSPFWRTEKLDGARTKRDHQGVRQRDPGRRPPLPHGAHALCRARRRRRSASPGLPAPSRWPTPGRP